MANRKYKDALEIFDKVIALERINAMAYYYRAICIEKRGATDRPEQKIFRAAAGMLDNPKEFEKSQVKANLLASLLIDPKLLDARLKLMEFYLSEKDVSNAREQMDEILKLSNPSTRSMTLQANLLLLEGDKDGAENVLRSIIERHPGYAGAYIRLGLLYDTIGNAQGALDYFQKAFEIEPDMVGLVKMMAEVYLREKKIAQAMDMVNKMESKVSSGKKGFFKNLKGELLLLHNEVDKAFELFLAAVVDAPLYIPPA